MKNSMDKLLREAFGARAGTVPPTPCLDAETAAALADGTLPARERSGADSHVADCLRCQAMLAALARTMPPMTPRVWWRRPAFVWLAPLTAVAAALLVWINIPRREIVSSTVQPGPIVLRLPDRDAAPPASPPAAADQPSQSARGDVTPPPGAAHGVPAPAAPPLAFRAPAAEQERDRMASQRDAEASRQTPLADSSAAEKAVPPPPPAAAERRESESVGQLQARPLPQVAGAPLPSADQAGSRAAAAERAPQVTETVTVATSNVAPQPLMRRLASETVIVSPNFASRWRIGTGGVVQHSADGGATWQTQTTGVSVSLVGGASPSPAVCWLVGPAGIVVVTKDEGRSWQRLPFPATVDLRSVRATDDKTATVVAADSRTFSTSDGGRTWR
jgi:hypothetical protein